MSEDKQEARCFTRADVEQFFEQPFGKKWRERGYEIQIHEIALLDGISPSTWAVDYTMTNEAIPHRYHDILLVRERASWLDGKKSLAHVIKTPLPQGCTTVADEDAALKAREEALDDEALHQMLRKPIQEDSYGSM